MSKDPAVLFYTADFMVGTALMSDEQVGKYMRLLCLQHQQGHLSEEDMLTICKSYDRKIFSKFTQDADGNYFNERMEKESFRRQKYSESRANNRRKSEPEEAHMENISKTYDEHMENENENINANININKLSQNKDNISPRAKKPAAKERHEETFKEFWSAYPKKRSKNNALKAWLKLKPDTALFEKIMSAIADLKDGHDWQREDGQFIPYPASWLNAGGWEDEPMKPRGDPPRKKTQNEINNERIAEYLKKTERGKDETLNESWIIGEP